MILLETFHGLDGGFIIQAVNRAPKITQGRQALLQVGDIPSLMERSRQPGLFVTAALMCPGQGRSTGRPAKQKAT